MFAVLFATTADPSLAQTTYDFTTLSDTNSVSTVNSNNVNTNNTSVNTTGSMVNDTRSDTRMRVDQPPPTAIAPSMMSGGNSDLCTTGISGAVQTQILGIAAGGTVRDLNCERLKLSKTLFDMGMKVAAVATMCQDRRVWDAMWSAGTPCPYDGKIGNEARTLWLANPDRWPIAEKLDKNNDTKKNLGLGMGLGILLLLLL